jgi:acyl carrier protein
MLTEETICRKVSATLVEALNLDEDEVRPTATLQGDLGAESIDFLDILFRLVRDFGIRIERNELFPESIFQATPSSCVTARRPTRGCGSCGGACPRRRSDLQSLDVHTTEGAPAPLSCCPAWTRSGGALFRPSQGRSR